MPLILLYGFRPIIYLMPVIRQMLGGWTELEASVWLLPASFVSLVLLYTWFNRISEAGTGFRWIWRWGRWLLVGSYTWSLVVLLWVNTPVLLRTDHRHYSALIVLALIDIGILAYLLRSKHVRQIFADFPVADAPETARLHAQQITQTRKQFMRDARLAAPVARTEAEAQQEAHWRNEITRSTPEAAMPWLELGVLAYQCGKSDQALLFMEQAKRLEPDNPLVLRNLCELLRQKGQLPRALECGERAVDLAPDEVARLNLAQVLVDLGQADRAISQYHRVLELNPHHVQTWLNLAVLLQQQNRKEDAQTALDAVLLIDPGHEQVLALKKQRATRP